MDSKVDNYSDYATEYADMVKAREAKGIEQEPIMPLFLQVLDDVSDLVTLDAGCGEGYLSRILARRGAKVTGIDISARLIEIARAKDPQDAITYQVADLSLPLPAYENHFDLVVSHLVLNDVFDYQGFLRTLGSVTKSGGHLVFSMNNPYSFVVRSHISDYFESGKKCAYRGMAEEGVKVYFYHRTLQEYIDACLLAGFQLQRLVDVPTHEGFFKRRSDTLIPAGYHFPFFMILSFVKA
ncbi:MAG TPA: class I SAM-dependent methyltransferase [Ktedonobacteraceae bacterium]|jgi:2-polyprenyl-3-methyl-5-hydroxy-6-metoxy-1,4-benzoquinol methylase|nr:class I SAM-dependent methyltransferase [Ktedonobacteraceae bacterium]